MAFRKPGIDPKAIVSKHSIILLSPEVQLCKAKTQSLIGVAVL